MALLVQLDFFQTEEESKIVALRKEVKRLQKSLDKVRKGTYARLCQLEKQQVEIIEEFESWKKTICQGKNTWQDFQSLPRQKPKSLDGIAMGW